MKYVVGIDLGTTNSSVSYVDIESNKKVVQQYLIPQLTAPQYVASKPSLPSYCYLASEGEWTRGELDLPWAKNNTFAVGAFALSHGSKVPTRMVASAKSWLCHHAASRKDRILPFDSSDEENRISPVEASRRYLDHIRRAWNYEIAKGNSDLELEQQEVILTVPASFDEAARALTAESAKLAGFRHITFLEEPQAAFYSWIATHETSWSNQLYPGAKIIVCDIGGGTTDFSLIEVIEKDGVLSFQRTAVGDHLLLGGDNLDTALTYFLEDKLKKQRGSELSSEQWKRLFYEAQQAKEILLGSDDQKICHLVIQGSGSSLVGGTIAVDVTKEEVQSILLEGFFPNLSWNGAVTLKKSSGMRTVGLPYEDDPCITKHLAHFIKMTCAVDSGETPDFILFNGGTMKAEPFRERILNCLKEWLPQKAIQELIPESLDLAVARGAAYYGKARKGMGIKIRSGSARSYYLELHLEKEGQKEKKVLCLLPRDCDEGTTFEPEHTFDLMPNTPISFKIWTSHVRIHDKQGDIIDIKPDDFHQLPPIYTVLRYGKKQGHGNALIPVSLQITYTAIGTIDLWLDAKKTEHRWKLEFQLRTSSGQEDQLATIGTARQDETFDTTHLEEAKTVIRALFTSGSTIEPGSVVQKLEEALGQKRNDWSVSVIRGLAEELLLLTEKRKLSTGHEGRWWNLAGFLLRPGFGHPLDDHRIKEMWKIILSDLKNNLNEEVLLQQWICYRRIAGGLKKGQQDQIVNLILPSLFNKKSAIMDIKGKSGQYRYSESLRVLGAMELINSRTKIQIGEAIIKKIQKGQGIMADFWVLGRLGARCLLYGSPADVLPREIAARWAQSLIEETQSRGQWKNAVFAVSQLVREVDQKELNVTQVVRDSALEAFSQRQEYDLLRRLMTHAGHRTKEEEEQVFGENLPPGLSLLL